MWFSTIPQWVWRWIHYASFQVSGVVMPWYGWNCCLQPLLWYYCSLGALLCPLIELLSCFHLWINIVMLWYHHCCETNIRYDEPPNKDGYCYFWVDIHLKHLLWICLLYTSDAADDLLCVDLGGRRIIKKKTNTTTITKPPHPWKHLSQIVPLSHNPPTRSVRTTPSLAIYR